MKVVDVIRETDSDCVIYFLLNSYIATSRDCDRLNNLPEQIAALPLTGKDDVRSRFEMLMFELDVASKRMQDNKCNNIKDALVVFSTALCRLQSIDSRRNRPREREQQQA